MGSDKLPLNKKQTIKVNQLRPGLKVHLSLSWLKHPFLRNTFEIIDEKQISIIKSLGITEIQYTPLTEEDLDLPEHRDNTGLKAGVVEDLWHQKETEIIKFKKLRRETSECEILRRHSLTLLKESFDAIFAKPEESIRKLEVLAYSMESQLSQPDASLRAMLGYNDIKTAHNHALNITVLTLIIARILKLKQEMLIELSLGAFLHDIGETQLPFDYLRKMQTVTPDEYRLYQQHPQIGVNLPFSQLLPKNALKAIEQHHEYYDGSGFPGNLSGDEISLLAQIVGIAENYYSSLCVGLTPHEAISMLFRKFRTKYNPNVLNSFIVGVGVYPPGSIVLLSDQSFGMVMKLNNTDRLKPYVLIYDPAIRRERSLLIDLAEENLAIEKACKYNEIPKTVFDYLLPGASINYYFS